MPILHLDVETGLQGGVELPALYGFFEVVGPVLVTEPDQPFSVFRDAAYFFGKTRVRISRMI